MTVWYARQMNLVQFESFNPITFPNEKQFLYEREIS